MATKKDFQKVEKERNERTQTMINNNKKRAETTTESSQKEINGKKLHS